MKRIKAYRIVCALIICVCALASNAQTRAVAELARVPQVIRALEYIKQIEPETVEEQIRLTEIPAPTFNETKRGEYFQQRFTELNLQNVRVDKAGNVIGERPGKSNETTLVLAAHLDTVFDENTDVKVRRDGNLLKAPGISDDGRGLTLLLAIARVLNEMKIETEGTIIFVANTGEEGLGNLKGTRHLFNEELKNRITHFISIDGAGLAITHAAVGSRRYRTTFRGAGGHSYGAFGMPNPIHALGRLIEKVSRFQVPQKPKTTFNVGKIAGGTSVNSISANAVLEVDMRSEDARELAKLDTAYKQAVEQSLNEENERWQNKERITVENALVGNRPAGAQNLSAPIVQIAVAADRFLTSNRTSKRAAPTQTCRSVWAFRRSRLTAAERLAERIRSTKFGIRPTAILAASAPCSSFSVLSASNDRRFRFPCNYRRRIGSFTDCRR